MVFYLCLMLACSNTENSTEARQQLCLHRLSQLINVPVAHEPEQTQQTNSLKAFQEKFYNF
jgi:hypothetical protein